MSTKPQIEIVIVVFKTLELLAPKPITMDWILAAPRSTLQLKCNMDDAVYKLDGQSSGIVNVSPDGVVHTKDTLGRDLIIVSVCAYPVCLPPPHTLSLCVCVLGVGCAQNRLTSGEIAFDLIRIVMYTCVCMYVYVHVLFCFSFRPKLSTRRYPSASKLRMCNTFW